MTNRLQHSASVLPHGLLAPAFAFALVVAVSMSATPSAQAQTYQVIHSFTGGGDGGSPFAGLSMDAAGNLYGTTFSGGFVSGNCNSMGNGGCGTVFRLRHARSGWLLTPLYNFAGGNDGSYPYGGVIIGPNGSLYGTTSHGGGSGNGCQGIGCGTVFNLTPPPRADGNILGGWTETVLHRFPGGEDGALPESDLVFDQAGNIYGTTAAGGGAGCEGSGCGTIFKLTLSSGGQWTESVVYRFMGGADGSEPNGGLIFDGAGNVYGTTALNGSYNCGTVFRLTPSGSGFTESTLYDFNPSQGDGCTPAAGLVFDALGNLYGTNGQGGLQGGGTVFELSPGEGGTWTEAVLFAFTGPADPFAALTFDQAGNLVGTTVFGDFGSGNGDGRVFKLTPSGNNWTYTLYHDFTGGNDGANSYSKVVFDVNGNLYGTALMGGANDEGVVWEITP